VEQIKKYVRKMIVIFPFEQEFYRSHGVDVAYVGHPLAFLPLPEVSREEFAARYKLDLNRQWIALLPGSRRREVHLNLPPLMDSVELLEKEGNDFEYLLPVASTLDKEWVRYQLGPAYKAVKLTENAQATVMLSRAAVVASGTATVETALTGTPFVVVYRLFLLTWLLGRRLVKLDTFAMPNLIAGKKIVPELIQSEFTGEAVVRELKKILPDGAARVEMQEALAEVKKKLAVAEAPALRAAEEILSAIG
jgi:lipid-A-disaccharide synthase